MWSWYYYNSYFGLCKNNSKILYTKSLVMYYVELKLHSLSLVTRYKESCKLTAPWQARFWIELDMSRSAHFGRCLSTDMSSLFRTLTVLWGSGMGCPCLYKQARKIKNSVFENVKFPHTHRGRGYFWISICVMQWFTHKGRFLGYYLFCKPLLLRAILTKSLRTTDQKFHKHERISMKMQEESTFSL